MFAFFSPRLLSIAKRKPTLVHAAIASFGIPLVAAFATIAHTSHQPFYLLEIASSDPYPHFRQQKYFQSPEHIYDSRLPIFDHDYNLIGEM